jgi:hypothetical protein
MAEVKDFVLPRQVQSLVSPETRPRVSHLAARARMRGVSADTASKPRYEAARLVCSHMALYISPYDNSRRSS